MDTTHVLLLSEFVSQCSKLNSKVQIYANDTLEWLRNIRVVCQNLQQKISHPKPSIRTPLVLVDEI